ncbi:DUF5825 family protein [Micromonospora psammae]
MPFAESEPVLAALRGTGHVRHDPAKKRAVVRIGPDETGHVLAAFPASGVAGLGVTIELDAWPGAKLAPRDVRALADAGVVMLKVDGGALTEHALPDWFELGKAALAHGLPLHWAGGVPSVAREHARHLTPPRDDPALRSSWRYGMLAWRRGPGFALVEDARDSANRLQYAMDLTALQSLFGEALDRHIPQSIVDPALLDQLVDMRLVAQLAGRAVWLPYRMRRWPVAPLA